VTHQIDLEVLIRITLSLHEQFGMVVQNPLIEKQNPILRLFLLGTFQP
jgi:hypothetical protein